jgi:hypothetical protein
MLDQVDATNTDLLVINYSTTCFGRLYAHRQESITARHCLWFSVLAVAVVVPESLVARCTHCEENVAWLSRPTSSSQCTQPGQKTIGSDTQYCSPADGRKDARNMLRNNWLPMNHYLLHLVGLAFICLPKMHGQSSIKFTNAVYRFLKCCHAKFFYEGGRQVWHFAI